MSYSNELSSQVLETSKKIYAICFRKEQDCFLLIEKTPHLGFALFETHAIAIEYFIDKLIKPSANPLKTVDALNTLKPFIVQLDIENKTEQEVKNFISENSFEIFSNNKRQSEMAHIRNDACQISLHAMKMKQSFKDYRFCDVNIQIQKKENENNLPANLINPFNPGKQNLA